MNPLATTWPDVPTQGPPSAFDDVFRIAFERSAEGIAITMPSGEHLHANKAFCDFVGYSAEELRNRRMLDLTHPDDRPRASAARDRLVRGELTQVSWERRFIHKSGLTFWALVNTTLVRDADNDPAYFISQIIDISDRKMAEDAVRAAENRLRALIGAMRDAIVVLDRAGRYVDVAPSATDVLHRAPADLLGRRLHDVFPSAQADAFQAAVEQALQTRSPVEMAYDLDVRGERCWFDSTFLPQAGDRVVWITRDATSRRRTEQALRESEEQLRQAQKMEAVGQLAGGIAHDFNNLLMAIMSNAELAAGDISESSPVAGYVDEIKNASRRARSLTQQLLAFSRRQMLQPVVLDLNSVVTESQLMIRRLMGATIAMEVKLSPDLGHVRADPGQLSQVLINLAVNARDAMPQGGRLTISSTNIEISRRDASKPGLKEGSYAALVVRDTGSGMTEDVRSRVFEPFFTTKPPGQGTGLGLSTAYGIVKQSGGYIDVESAPSAGTTFTVLLPQAAEAVSATAAPAVVENMTPMHGTILLVEDEAAVRDATRRMLGRHGFTVIEAANGVDAMDIWERQNQSIDIVLTDVVMPSMGGADLVRSLRQRRPNIRVVFMSGYTQGALDISEIDESTTRFLNKPFTYDQLLETLQALLQNST
jgi:two-component system cell cycle sensor histidine kinase/response regulator CckA